MKVVHFVCNRTDSEGKPLNLVEVKGKTNTFLTCSWFFDKGEDPYVLENGGMVFLHKKQADAPFRGGKVKKIHKAEPGDARFWKGRFNLEFEEIKPEELKEWPWQGKRGRNIVSSGIIDV